MPSLQSMQEKEGKYCTVEDKLPAADGHMLNRGGERCQSFSKELTHLQGEKGDDRIKVG